MKRLLCFLLCLLPALACAEDYVTLAELRAQVGDGWHETFIAKGREVVVQADINWFPEVDACPMLEVAGAVSEQPGPEFTKLGNRQVKNNYDCTLYWFWMKENPYLDRSECNTWGHVDYTVYGGEVPTLIPEELDVDYPGLLAQIDADISTYTGLTLADFRIDSVQVKSIRYELEGTREDGTPILGNPRSTTGNYWLKATQLHRGIPMVEAFNVNDIPRGKLSYLYYSQGWRYYTLYCSREVSVLQEDVPLLSFEAMKQVWRKQIEAGKLRGIDELEFGYLACKSGKQFITLPVWRIKGGYSNDPNRKNVMPYQNPRDEEGSLTVPSTYTDYYYNAQTGEMLSASTTSARKLPKSGILTWEDVQ